MVSARIRHRKGRHMSQQNEQDQEKFKPGVGTLLWGVFWGLFWMVALPIVTLLMAGASCAAGACFFADHSMATMVVSAILGFLCGLGGVISRAEERFKKQQDEDRQRRLEQAQLRWLEQQEEENNNP